MHEAIYMKRTSLPNSTLRQLREVIAEALFVHTLCGFMTTFGEFWSNFITLEFGPWESNIWNGVVDFYTWMVHQELERIINLLFVCLFVAGISKVEHGLSAESSDFVSNWVWSWQGKSGWAHTTLPETEVWCVKSALSFLMKRSMLGRLSARMISILCCETGEGFHGDTVYPL